MKKRMPPNGQTQTKPRPWMRVREYAKLHGVTKSSVYERIERGTIESKTEHGLKLVRAK